ncbi:MAG: sugar-binding domain-containing protein, partial [Chloroflexota bacterium]
MNLRRSFFFASFFLLALAACTAAPTKTPIPTRVAPTATLSAPTRAPATATPVVKPWGTRQEISLDGKWEYVQVKSLDDALPTGGWQAFNVPGLLGGYDYERAWFRRKFTASENWRGQKLLLHFGGVKFNSRVLVNGKNVGGAFNGYDAFDVDISDAVRFGAENELAVGVHDWTGIFNAGAQVDFPPGIDSNALRGVPRDRVLAPIG